MARSDVVVCVGSQRLEFGVPEFRDKSIPEKLQADAVAVGMALLTAGIEIPADLQSAAHMIYVSFGTGHEDRWLLSYTQDQEENLQQVTHLFVNLLEARQYTA